MKPLQQILTALLLVNAALSYGQFINTSEQTFSGYDSEWHSTNLKKAIYFTRHKKMNDTCWQWDTYYAYGPLMRSQQFSDVNSTKAHGRLVIYNKDGIADSLCYYTNGLPNGHWYINTDSGHVVQYYNMGVLVSTKKEEKKDPKQKDTLKKDEKESEFPGGAVAWQRYLNKNLEYPQRAYKASIQGEVIVNFIITPTGDVGEHFLYHSIEYTLDEVALRIIRESPKWTPAFQGTKFVNSYKRQPIVFGLQRR